MCNPRMLSGARLVPITRRRRLRNKCDTLPLCLRLSLFDERSRQSSKSVACLRKADTLISPHDLSNISSLNQALSMTVGDRVLHRPRHFFQRRNLSAVIRAWYRKE
jgi:hypothetical protein